MYSMYSRNFTGPIYDRLMKKPREEKYSLDSAANRWLPRAQNNLFLAPYQDVPGPNPGKGKQIVFFRVTYD